MEVVHIIAPMVPESLRPRWAGRVPLTTITHRNVFFSGWICWSEEAANSSVPQDVVTFSPGGFSGCFHSAHHIPFVQWRWEKSKHPGGAAKGQREPLLFLHNVKFADPPRVFAAALAGKNTTRQTGDRSLALGKSHDGKQSGGRMFFPRPIGKQSPCFRLSSRILGNVFFHNLAQLLFWPGKFIFVLPSMWLQQNVTNQSPTIKH